MVNESQEWLTVPDVAQALDVSVTAVHEMIRVRDIVAVRRGERQTWQVPADFIEMHESRARVIPALRGTLIMLSDARMSDEESIEWLMSESAELGSTPLAALREGKRAPVRRAAQTLG